MNMMQVNFIFTFITIFQTNSENEYNYISHMNFDIFN